MLALITGGSGSGKSEYAEELICSLGDSRVYLATMKVSGEEGFTRIMRHLRQREGRGFLTVEKETAIADITIPPEANVLLEDMGNLLANTMFDPERKDGGIIVDNIIKDVEDLNARCRNLVIVTNDVFSGGDAYGEETVDYMKNLALINRRIAGMADLAAEISCGLADILKGEI